MEKMSISQKVARWEDRLSKIALGMAIVGMLGGTIMLLVNVHRASLCPPKNLNPPPGYCFFTNSSGQWFFSAPGWSDKIWGETDVVGKAWKHYRQNHFFPVQLKEPSVEVEKTMTQQQKETP